MKEGKKSIVIPLVVSIDEAEKPPGAVKRGTLCSKNGVINKNYWRWLVVKRSIS